VAKICDSPPFPRAGPAAAKTARRQPVRSIMLAGVDDALAAARSLVDQLYPTARWALLAGSVATVDRTSGSDLDVIVFIEDDPQAPYRRSLTWQGFPAEVFTYDQPGLEHYLRLDLAHRRPVTHRMLATGIPLTDLDGHAVQVRHRCADLLAAGPPRMDPVELDGLRYQLTGLLTDLTHAGNPGARTVIAASTWTRTAELALHAAGHWSGSGKWLLRELVDLDPGFAGRWLAAHSDPAAVVAIADEVLGSLGGRLFDGHLTTGPSRPG